jgi:hypothetical protein
VRDAQILQVSQNIPSNNNSANLHNDSKVETPSLVKSEAVPAARITPPSNEAMYRDDSKKVVIDSIYRLMWQDGADIFEGDWDEAERYCENLNFAGYLDWRLPNRLELLSIEDDSMVINESFKYIGKDEYGDEAYWSSTENSNISSTAWVVVFEGDDGYWEDISVRRFVRCVRQY